MFLKTDEEESLKTQFKIEFLITFTDSRKESKKMPGAYSDG